MRWMLGREENGKNWGEKRMGKNGKNRKDRKIGITQFELVINCHQLTCFYTLRFKPLFVIRSIELEIEYTISHYLSPFLIAKNGQNLIGTGGLVQCDIFQILFQL